MAWIQMTSFSEVLGMDVDLNVCLPNSAFDKGENMPLASMYLLHGAQGNCDDFIRRTGIERYAKENNIAVVMPSGYLSAYQDMAFGANVYSYVSEELIGQMPKIFRIPFGREQQIIAGISMGGRGALLIGLKRPDLFSKIACFSCGIDMQTNLIPWDLIRTETDNTDFDIRQIARNIDKEHLPEIYMQIGKEDVFLESARESQKFLKQIYGEKGRFFYGESDGGHDWDFWDRAIRDYIDSLQLPKRNDLY